MKILTQLRPALLATIVVVLPNAAAKADILYPAFDSVGRISTATNIDKNYTGNMAVGPVSGTDYFRTYLTFDLTSATTATGETSLTLKAGTGGESNTSSVAQVFTLFSLPADWDGATQPGPGPGTVLATVIFTPTTGNDTQNIIFASTALTDAFNAATGGSLYLGIKSDAEGADARSFKWFGSANHSGVEPQLTYTPPDPTPPAILPPTVPAGGDTGVLVSTSLVATFSEPIALEDGGTITIDDLGGTDTVITLPDPRVSVSGSDLVITPDPPLAVGTDYAIRISNNAVKDLAPTPNFFPGISDTTTWNFQTAADGTAPGLVLPTTPADGDTGVATNTNLIANFDEAIMAGSGNIRIRNLSTSRTTVIPVGDPQVSISGSTLTIDPATDLGWADDYAILIDAGAITDVTGNPFAGILDEVTWNFTVAGGKLLAAFDTRADTASTIPLDKTNTADLAIGPVSSPTNIGRFFRTYLTFDLSGAAAATGDTTLVLSPAGVENNTSSVPQTFTLFVLGADWDGATQPWPDGTAVATISFTPRTSGDDNRGISFTSAALTTAFNNALGGNLYLGIMSDAEGVDARSFLWLASAEEPDFTGYEPRLNYNLAAGGSTFAGWIAAKPGVNGQTGLGDDPDGDGIDNGVENFFGTEPGEFSAGLVAGTANPVAGTFTFTHPQGSLAGDLTRRYRWSTDLATFHDDGASSGGTTVNFSTLPNPPEAGTLTTVTATVTGTPVPKLFVRVEVTQN